MGKSKGRLCLKRAFVLFMGALLVWQSFGTEVTYAFAQGSIETVQALAQTAGDTDNVNEQSSDVALDGSDGSEGSTANGVADGESEGENETGNSLESSEPSENGESDGTEGQSDEDDIDPVSDGEVAGTYNPDAAFVDVSDDCTATVTLYKDASHKTELGSTTITSSENFYAALTVWFRDTTRPTLENPNVMYRFPDNVKVANMDETDLMDGTSVGKWWISDNVAYFKYNEDYLSQTVTHAYLNLDCKLEGVNKGDGSSEVITFNGASTTVTVNTKDGSVSGSKFGGDMSQTWNGPSYDQATNSYTWTIKISPNAYATDVKISDTIGSNLSFVDGSFKLVDASGQDVSGKCEATVSGQNATISLGDLTAGDYYVQYKTTVNSLPDADNTAISNVNNKATYSWGASDNRKNGNTEKSPQEAKYSMVSKSADGSSTPSAIKWVVKLNNGSIKADMGGYTFTDELGSDQTFTDAAVEIKDSDGNVVSATVTKTDTSLSFTLPDDAGKKQYTVTYYTQMTDTDSKDAVRNTAKVTPSDPTHGPEGEGTGTYNPPDHGTYITKALTSDITSADYDGKASWKSEILFSDMAANTDPSKVVFTDEFSQLPSDVKVSLDGDVKLTVGDGGAALVEGTDYSIDKASGEQWPNNKLFTVTFKDSDTVKNLIGQADAKVVVTYNTLTTQVDSEYPAGTYKNKSSVKTDKKSTVSAEASYTIEKEATPPAVIKDGTSSSWDADYSWSDGTKGAWITNWTAYVNRTSKSDGSAAVDLGGKDVTVTDSLPANSELVASSAKYKLMDKGGYNGSKEQSIDFTSSDGIVTFVISTKDAKYSWGSDMGTQVSVVLTYQTATKGSIDSKDEITNTAQASSGSYTFPEGSDTVTVDNKALAKTGNAVPNSSAREYTVTVNENAYDLVSGSDVLTLVDDLDYRGELAASTISVKSSEGIDLLASGQASYELSKVAEGGNTHTRLTIKVPDSMKVVVTYRVVPSGNAGDLIVNFSNSCSLSGVKSSATKVTQTFNIATSSGGTGSESWGITLTKYDSSGKKVLSGATFELWRVDLDNSTADNIVAEKVDTQVSDASGKVSFGTKENPLVSNTLYYFVETEAPSGYEISYTGNTYVMLKSDATKDDYEAAYNKAVKLGVTPSSASSYSAFDELSAGSFDLDVEKVVKGDEAPKDATFTFHAEATGENAASAPVLADVTVTTDAKGEKTYSGKFTGSLSDSMNGETFTYVVRESGTAPSGWTYDSGAYTATVAVTEQGAKLVANVTYVKNGEDGASTSVDKMTFTNSYKAATGSFTLKAKKTVNSGALKKDESFTFSATATGENADAAPTIENAETDTDGIAEFAAVDITEASIGKTFTYIIHEEDELDETHWTRAADVIATVTVGQRGEDGKIPVTVKYDDQESEYASFDNKYEAKAAKGEVKVEKTVNGGPIETGERFTFTLLGADGEKVAGTEEVAATKDSPTVSFGELEFKEAGTYAYTVHETSELGDGWTNDDDFAVTFTVELGEDRDLHVTDIAYGQRGYEADGSVVAKFDDRYEAEGAAAVKVSKTVNGAAPADDQSFDFELRAVTEGAPMPAGAGSKATTTGSAAADFGSITYRLSDAGKTYEYQIVETSELGAGWTAASPLKVTVTVGEDNGDGTLKESTVVYGGDATATSGVMNNLFEAGSGTISVEKTVNGGPIAEGERFTFTLLDGDNRQVGSEVTATKESPTVSFDELAFDSVGTYAYTVHETTELADGWTNDDDITVTLTVGSVDGRLVVTGVEYGDDARGYDEDGSYIVKFDNKYEAKAAKGEVKVEKTVNGGPIETGERFTFTLLGADGEKVAGTEEVAATKDSPTVSFGELEFKEAGTYAYTVHETSELGDGWTNDDDFAVTFTVELGEDRDLHVTDIAYGQRGYEADGSVVAKFDDRYEAPEVPEDKDKKEEDDKPKEKIPQTGDLYGAVGISAVYTAAAGLVLVALGLRRSRCSR